ncbi:hypothetical protein CERZMDRAFT_102178 [Cercospora zeae-maydis SCOH1-5]|uniref:Uncharacterized protein n=1 Tax=Cercospora zeae-maydis SCOH1-5 TaxID=717836 RepID=A0A6A6F391_9PEZI|nr:hypothetical protein CERZMDRAFT_102178 [Cercospora zeae-maydis SCOH1-5]
MAKPPVTLAQGHLPLLCAFIALATWFMFQMGIFSHSSGLESGFTELALGTSPKPDIAIKQTYDQDDYATIWFSSLLIERANDQDDSVEGWMPLNIIDLYNPDDSNLSPRARLVRDGLNMECKMRAALGDPSVPQTGFPSYRELQETYGWDVAFDHTQPLTNYYMDTDYLEQIGVSADTAKWMTITPMHSESGQWEPTDAIYMTHVNLQDGMLIAASSFSPASQNEKNGDRLTEDQIVPLQKWSDVAWLTYNDWLERNIRFGRPTKMLEHVLRYHILTEEVQVALQDITGRTLQTVGTFPGRSYPIKTAEALAALGTPHGKGVAWFFAQHKTWLGVRTVDRVNIFNCPKTDGEPQWCIYFHIVDIADLPL